MTWTWRMESADGTELDGASVTASPGHGSQADAESWLGEEWHGLADQGVAQVSLLDNGALVYGPMPLSE